MPKNYGTARLKNHVSKVAPGTLSAMVNLFGVGPEDFAKAVAGDQEKIKLIADMGRLSENAIANLPLALEKYRSILQGTGDLNEAYAELVQLTQTHGTRVLKASNGAELSEQRFKHEGQEIKATHVNNLTAEETRHLRATNLITINAETASLMAEVRYNDSLNNAANKVIGAQTDADRKYEQAVTNALWKKGSEAQLDLITRTDYKGTAKSTNAFAAVGDWFKKKLGL